VPKSTTTVVIARSPQGAFDMGVHQNLFHHMWGNEQKITSYWYDWYCGCHHGARVLTHSHIFMDSSNKQRVR